MRRDCGRMRPATAGACATRLRALHVVPIATRMQMDNTTTAERQHDIPCVHRLWLTSLMRPTADELCPATADDNCDGLRVLDKVTATTRDCGRQLRHTMTNYLTPVGHTRPRSLRLPPNWAFMNFSCRAFPDFICFFQPRLLLLWVASPSHATVWKQSLNHFRQSGFFIVTVFQSMPFGAASVRPHDGTRTDGRMGAMMSDPIVSVSGIRGTSPG